MKKLAAVIGVTVLIVGVVSFRSLAQTPAARPVTAKLVLDNDRVSV